MFPRNKGLGKDAEHGGCPTARSMVYFPYDKTIMMHAPVSQPGRGREDRWDPEGERDAKDLQSQIPFSESKVGFILVEVL